MAARGQDIALRIRSSRRRRSLLCLRNTKLEAEIGNCSRDVALAALAIAVVLVGSYFAFTDRGQDQTPRITIPTSVQQYDDGAPQTSEDFESDSKMGRSPRETPVPGSNTVVAAKASTDLTPAVGARSVEVSS